ncbi:hypothetical protein [Haloglomus litoreum]|uniref:hypothetical protein n=1 Tax=Haloglomus litoreum TaxID=3034026 RepID=UPI0023E82294|nr:hypothetical protein [Haloglomus sp. DT116]
MSALVVFAWLLGWGFVGLSVILASTAGAPAGPVDALLQSVGLFYLDATGTLQEFAGLTAIPARWTDALYALVATIPLGFHVFTGTGAASEPDSGDEVDGGDFVFGIGTIVGFCAILGALLFGLGAELLAISIVSVLLGLVVLGLGIALA